MRLLIAAPSASGHHMALHARLLAREATRRAWQVALLTTPTAAAHPALDLVRREVAGDLSVHLMPDLARPPAGALASVRWQLAYHKALASGWRAIPRAARPDCVYVVDLDSVARAIAVRGSPFGGAPFAGMLMGLGYHRRAMGIGPTRASHAVQRLMVARLLALPRLRAVALIDECLMAFHARRPARRHAKLHLVPDAGEVPGASATPEARRRARETLGIAPDAFVVLAYGSLSARKGIAPLLEGVAALPDARVTALLAGGQDDGARRILAGATAAGLRAAGRLVESPGFHDADRERAVFEAADAVWVGYVDFHGSSGVLYQAGSVGLPVVASREGLVGWVTERHGTGVTCDPRDARSVRDALEAVRDAGDRERMATNARTLAAAHTELRFATALGDVAMGAAG